MQKQKIHTLPKTQAAQKAVSALQRLERYNELNALKAGDKTSAGGRSETEAAVKENISLDCGWGKLIFGQTFINQDDLIEELASERSSDRDIAFYVPDHHILLGRAPELLFLDPSDTYRFWLHMYRPPKRRPRSFKVRMLQDIEDARAINRVARSCGMLEAPEEKIVKNQRTRIFCYYLAERISDGRVIGAIMGIDHREALNDPTNGSSFWCLSVDPEARARGVGRALVREVAEHFLARGRDYLDLSVMHDNKKARKLYRSLGFRRIPLFTVKRRNKVNRNLYLGGPR
ncbi:MAG: GNAT family N-acetyltransferase [Bacillota bacterium]|nr:GNAT family N-acetyltransferase [Bacillota bacterium]